MKHSTIRGKERWYWCTLEGDKRIFHALHHKGQAFNTIIVKPNPLTHISGLWVFLQKLSPFIIDFGGEHDPILIIHLYEVKLGLGLFPWKKGAVFTIPNIIYILDSFVIKIKSPRVSESLSNEFKAIRQLNIRMQEFHKGAERKLVGTFNHDFFFMQPFSN
jgi:hypothetical protein